MIKHINKMDTKQKSGLLEGCKVNSSVTMNETTTWGWYHFISYLVKLYIINVLNGSFHTKNVLSLQSFPGHHKVICIAVTSRVSAQSIFLNAHHDPLHSFIQE